MKKLMTRVILAAAGTALIATGAIAASPETGTVSKAAPTVKWAGDTTNSYVVLNPMGNAPEQVPCDGTHCDVFTLTVAEDAPNLEVAVNIDDDDATAGIRIARPDGTVEYDSGTSSTKSPFKLKIKDAKKGDYEIGIVNNFVATITYKASATALFAAPVVAEPTPEVTPAPTPAPAQPGQQAQPAPPTLTVQNGKASAKKLKKARKLAITASSSAPLTSVTAEIRKGSKRLASAKVAKLEGTQKISVKVKKGLKAGSYVLRVVGTDAQSRRVQGQGKLKVTK